MKNLDSANAYGAVPKIVNEFDDEESQDDGGMFNSRFLNKEGSSNSYQSSVASLFASVKFGRDEDGGLQELGGTATIFSEVMSITKNVLGAGVLSMSGGLALYADDPKAVLSGSLWILLQAVIFGYFCLVIAKVCKLTESKTIRECWEKTVGSRGSVAVVVVIGLNPCQGTLAYSAILAQTFMSLCATAGFKIEYIPSLLIVTIGALLPLCLMKNIHALAPFSILGTTSVLLTAFGMIYRCIDGSYRRDGRFFDDIPSRMQPKFGDYYEPWSPKVMPLVCMIFEAYVMHYNSPRFYMELRHRTIPRFSQCVAGAFGLSTSIYVAIAGAGYLTFGGNSDSYILNNYSPRDPLATACRSLIGISVLTIYPIAFIGFRDAVIDVMRVPEHRQTKKLLNTLTIIMLSLITVTAMFVTDLGVINSVGGGTIAVLMCFVFPAVMFQKAISDLGESAVKGQRLEVILVLFLTVVGVVIGTVGVFEEVALGVA